MQTAIPHRQPGIGVPERTRTDERAARRSLRVQVERLESELAGLFTSAWPGRPTEVRTGTTGAGPSLLSLEQLELLRDDLVRRVADGRRESAERSQVEQQHRIRIEAMLLEPERHRWVRVTNADIGEPGCKQWHVRPRLGLLGRLMGWWRVRISSGCPLAEGRGPRPRPAQIKPQAEPAQHEQRRLAEAAALGQQA